MIQLVDKALEQFLRADVPLPERAADISFQPPDRTWGAGLTRPTVNVFLWDVSPAAGFSSTGIQQRVSPAGAVQRRPGVPVMEMHYLITAWASELRDEHQLLGNVMQCILAHPDLPADFVPSELAGNKWSLSLAGGDRRVPGEFWSALGGTLKPGLQIALAIPVEAFAWKEAAAPAEQVAVNVTEMNRSARNEPAADQAARKATLSRRRHNGALLMEGRPARSDGPDKG